MDRCYKLSRFSLVGKVEKGDGKCWTSEGTGKSEEKGCMDWDRLPESWEVRRDIDVRSSLQSDNRGIVNPQPARGTP